MNPKISVIVPIYNAEKWLRRCIDSLLSQTFQDFELLLIDDGSTDNSGKICEEYAELDSRIHVFHKPNGGLSSARNCGIDNAKGEWITFCDSDDFVYSSWLDNYNIDEAGDADLIQQGAVSDKPVWMKLMSEKRCGFDYCGEPLTYFKICDSQKSIGYAWIKLYKNAIIKRHNLRFDTELHFQEDIVFLLNYLYYCKIIKSHNKQGYFYFVPDWNKKYNTSIQEDLRLKKSLADYSDRLFADKNISKIVRNYKDAYVFALMNRFGKVPKLNYLREICRLHKKDYQCSHLTAPLKWLIVHDGTMIISSVALFVHSNLRKIFRNQ